MLRFRRFDFRLIARITGMLLIYLSVGMAVPLAASLYSRDGRHGLFFQFCRAIDGAVLNELDRVQASWQLLRPAQVSSFDAHAF